MTSLTNFTQRRASGARHPRYAHASAPSRQRGFTLTELIIVVVILGVVGAIYASGSFGSGASAGATAAQMSDLADKGTAAFSGIRTKTGVSADPTTANTLFQGDNNLLDLMYGGSAHVSTINNYRTVVNNLSPPSFSRALKATTAPASGTAGVYQLANSNIGVTVAVGSGTNEVNWVYTNVLPEVVTELATSVEGATYDGSTADTTGNLQYTAVSAGFHTVTLVRKAG